MQMTRRFSFVRGLSLADFMTMANGLGGAAAVLAVLGYIADGRLAWLVLALALYPLCLAMDFFDGRVARAQRQVVGARPELDSLSDVISFGVAPAALAYAAGLRGGWDIVALIYFVCCGVSRLARYNVTAEALSADSGKVTYFEGTPIPTTVLLTAVLAFAAGTGRLDELYGGSGRSVRWALHPLALLFVAFGTLMVSKTLRIPKL